MAKKFVGRRQMGASGRIGIPYTLRNLMEIDEDTVIDFYYEPKENQIILIPVTGSEIGEERPDESYALA
jgi:bifunctional DNA-binding transcriptional regulator/antitoxin component of YhaV-PrlF toxin-antitoxin module